MRRHRGFVLVIVVAVLGVLAAMAVQLVQKSTEARMLSNLQVGVSKVRLMCRSGLEFGMATQIHRIVGGAVRGSNGTPLNVVLDPLAGTDITRVMIKDFSGCLNPNDGVNAGALELGAQYVANQVDPWPTGTLAAPWPTDQAEIDDPLVISGIINLRIRALFNAYGDAHRYVSQQDLGWPGSSGHAPGTSFTFTATESAPRGVSIPGRDTAGLPLVGNNDIAQSSTGLGDRIVAARPAGGYASLSEVTTMINEWGAEHLPSSYLGGQPFFDKVSDDVALDTFEDDTFFRLREEHGRFEADPLIPPSRQSQIRFRRFLDSDPPDFVNHQKFLPHSVALINLNAASDLVKAAVFYAPSNVSYLCEGTAPDQLNTNGKFMATKSPRDWIGVGGPSFDPARMTENGVPDPAHVQPDRLMSLTDALSLAALYGDEDVPPVSFPQFSQWLSELRMSGSIPYERASPVVFPSFRLPYITPPNVNPAVVDLAPAYFTPEYVELTLPHIFSCVRRLPGYMGAPCALLSPYLQQGENKARPEHQVFQGPCLRSAEDIVFRCHIPKVAFVPHGKVRIRAKGVLSEGSRRIMNTLTAEVLLHETRIIRSQEDFEHHTVPADTSSSILIGPEPRVPGNTAPHPIPPSPHFGFVGLRDLCEDYPQDSIGQARLRLDFNSSLAAVAGSNSNLLPKDSQADPWIIDSLVEEPPADGYPLFGLNTFGDDWPTARDKIQTLRDQAPIQNRTWRYPTGGRDMREELYLLAAQSLNIPVDPAISFDDLNQFFLDHADLFQDFNGDQVDLVIDLGDDPDEISWNAINTTFWATTIYDANSIDPDYWWHMWASEGHNKPIVWHNGAPKQGDRDIEASNMEDETSSYFSGGSDLSPFGGLLFSAMGHGARAAKPFSDSFYLRPMDIFDPTGPSVPPNPTNVLAGSAFNRGYVSLWVRMPSGYHSSNVRRSLFQLTLWDRVNMQGVPQANNYSGQPPTTLASQLSPLLSTYRPTEFSLYLEGDSQLNPGMPTDALYTVVAKHQKDQALKRPTDIHDYPNWYLPEPIAPAQMGVQNMPTSAALFASSSNLASILSPCTQVAFPTSLGVPNPIAYATVNDYNSLYKLYYGIYDRNVNPTPGINANVSKESQDGAYANLPGRWRRIVCRWDLQIPPTAAIPERLAVVTDPHLNALGRPRGTTLHPPNTHAEKKRPYQGLRSGHPGMIWSFGEVVTCFDPLIWYGGGICDITGLWEPYGGAMYSNFGVSAGGILAPIMQTLYPQGPHPYPVLSPGHTYPLMRLNSSIDNIVIRMGEIGASSNPPNPSQGDVETWVESNVSTQAHRYPVDAGVDPPVEPKWTLNPELPMGAKLLYVGARIYDLPFLYDAQASGDLAPWQTPRVDFEFEDSDGSCTLDNSPATVGQFLGTRYTSPAMRHPPYPRNTGPSARLRLIYKAEDAEGHSLDSDGDNWNFSDIPWIQEVSWSYIPSQPKFLSFVWD
ncbi:MAG: type IV pilin protein [Planctomycetota bacterium]